ncbi:hypothetical protein FQR65_LT01267 [Abscondita terminalis]|nr:hypothetical protein FQR65_LT01267 [Abscondita terminalis]
MSDEYQWHFDYTRLVRDTGFTFQLHRPKSSILKSLAHIDIDKIILHQDIALVDKNINAVLEYTLDNEQSSVLDQNYVKIFYISQLSIQYLLFCKKYLDNTVAHLKKEVTNSKEVINKLNRKLEEAQEEVANAKTQVKDLQSTLTCQITNTQSIPVFQCGQCPKVFSTEEYLLAHTQRRHENVSYGTSFQVETDKLQSEIKALKERLNNTEKFIHHEDEKLSAKFISSSIKNNTVENTLLTELQHKFEMLKMHVDNELRMLQTQKFDQGKYEKWFETFLSKLDCYTKEKCTKSVQSDMNVVVNNLEECEVCLKKSTEKEKNSQQDHTTQTDASSPICENCQKRSSLTTTSSAEQIEDKVSVKAENTFEKLEEMLQKRVSGSLEKLENQMQSFCDKMQEFEKQTFSSHRTTPSPTHSADIKIVPKPRKKWNPRPLSGDNPYVKSISSSPKRSPREEESTILKEKIPNVIEIQPRAIEVDVEEIITQPKEIVSPLHVAAERVFDNTNVVSNNKNDANAEEKGKESTSETEVEEPNKLLTTTVKPKLINTPVVKQQPTFSLKNAVTALSFPQNRQKRTIGLLNKQLVQLGVSSDWSTLPTNSYHRALNIVMQQSNTAKKTYPDYNQIRDRILQTVEEEIRKRNLLEPKRVSNAFPRRLSNNQLKYASESETDSENTMKDRNNVVRKKENFRSYPQKAYFDVIQEFSSKTKMKVDTSDMSADSDTSTQKDDHKIERAKGVLKNFPSVGSLHKKKVLFNLKSLDNGIQKSVGMHDGSTKFYLIMWSVLKRNLLKPYVRRISSYIDISEEVNHALHNNLPTVALESTIITHGMPFPKNLECAKEVQNIVQERGATPATIAILNGRIKVGLTETQLAQLADVQGTKAIKTSRRDFGYVLANRLNGGTTVAGTLIVAKDVGIEVFGTGGLGGVHREAAETFDVSADLIELGKSPVAVISSGVKSILDIPKTLEYLETQGVFVASYGNHKAFPAFYSRTSNCEAPYNVASAFEAANIIRSHFKLGLNSGLLFAVPVPEEFAMNGKEINEVIEQAMQNAKEYGISGKEITPYLLAEISKITKGSSLQTNIALIKNNAVVAADIALELAKLKSNSNGDTRGSGKYGVDPSARNKP